MFDCRGRDIHYLRISVTDRCNLRCVYCMPAEGVEWVEHSEILTYEEILRLARLFARLGIDRIRLTGGEPLARRGLDGLIAGLKKNKLADQLISFFSYVGISIPSFWFGLLLIIVFSLLLHLLPGSGMHEIGRSDLPDLIRHLIMPSLVLSVGNVATFTRYIRSNTISQLEEEYVLTAKSKGATQKHILFGHVLKNCLLPVITLAGMHFASLVTGSFIVESVFGWPGMGTLGMSAINNRDYPMIMGFTMLSCLLLIIGNLVADLLYYVADPRIKSGLKEVRG